MAALRTVLAVMVFATSAAIADDQRKADALHMQAVKLEMAGKNREAVKQYIEAARLGSAKAAWRLGEIYDKGIPGI